MIQLLNKIKVVYLFIKLCINPESTASAAGLQRQINKIATSKQKKRYVDKFNLARPGYLANKIAVNTPVGFMPEGSLGFATQEFYRLGGWNVGDLRIYDKPKDDFQLLTNDMWEGHDLTHVLTGFGTDHKGEMGTFGFLCAQYPSPMSIMLVAIGVINTLFHMKDCEQRLESLFCGWDMGRKANSIIGVDWNLHWNQPLTDVRNQFNILNGRN